MPQLALEPRTGDAPARELGHQFDEVGTLRGRSSCVGLVRQCSAQECRGHCGLPPRWRADGAPRSPRDGQVPRVAASTRDSGNPAVRTARRRDDGQEQREGGCRSHLYATAWGRRLRRVVAGNLARDRSSGRGAGVLAGSGRTCGADAHFRSYGDVKLGGRGMDFGPWSS